MKNIPGKISFTRLLKKVRQCRTNLLQIQIVKLSTLANKVKKILNGGSTYEK